ncbi:MAG: hypothetical protein FI718_03720 [SAR202 cluster bacterium]|nr:hypothetical protein [SAR202 cluster bacterium]|tara:strand:- start:21 stop:200 length:180 start_codon:yes stop_codon:yes gene_type:complete
MKDNSNSDANKILPRGRKDIIEATKRQILKGNIIKAILIFVWVFMPLNMTRRHLASLKK